MVFSVHTFLLVQALRGIQSHDATTRKASEDAILETPLPKLLPALATTVASPAEETSDRQLAAVLIRRVMQSKFKYESAYEAPIVYEELLVQVLNGVCAALAPDVPNIVRRAAAEAVGDLWYKLRCKGNMSFLADRQKESRTNSTITGLLWLGNVVFYAGFRSFSYIDCFFFRGAGVYCSVYIGLPVVTERAATC